MTNPQNWIKWASLGFPGRVRMDCHAWPLSSSYTPPHPFSIPTPPPPGPAVSLGYRYATIHGRGVFVQLFAPAPRPDLQEPIRCAETLRCPCKNCRCLETLESLTPEPRDWKIHPNDWAPPEITEILPHIQDLLDEANAMRGKQPPRSEWSRHVPRDWSSYPKLPAPTRKQRAAHKALERANRIQQEKLTKIWAKNIANTPPKYPRVINDNEYCPNGVKYHAPRGTPKFDDYLL